MAQGDGAPCGGKTLYLLRHAKSSWKEKNTEDFDRPLNKRGRLAATAMGEYLARQGISPGQVLCSSAKRTRETMERVQEAIGSAVPVRFEKGIYMAEQDVLLRRLRQLNDSVDSAMLVGHNPGLEGLAKLLAGEIPDDLRLQNETKFPTGSLAIIRTSAEHWADLTPGCGRIAAFIRARDIGESGRERGNS